MPEKNKSRVISFFIKVAILTLLSVAVLAIAAFLYNNVSLSSDNVFSNSVDSAINKTTEWIKNHEKEIFSKTVNVALLKMLQDCDQMSGKPVFAKHISQFMKRPLRPAC